MTVTAHAVADTYGNADRTESDRVATGMSHDAVAEDFDDLLQTLATSGAKLSLNDGDVLRVSALPGQLDDRLRSRLVAHKPRLLQWLKGAAAGDAAERTPTVAHDAAALYQPFPPSDLQTSFLIGHDEGLDYHVRPHQYLELDFDTLDAQRYEVALNAALRRQRNNLVVVRADLDLEVVRDPAPVAVTVHDFGELDGEAAETAIGAVRAEMVARELPLDSWPWVDFRISRYAGSRARLHVNNNNFFSDGPGTGRLLHSVMQYYDLPDEPQPEIRISYRDAVQALAALEVSARGIASKKYWTDRIDDWPSAPEIPLVASRGRARRSDLNRREIVLTASSWAALKTAAGARGLTPTNALHAVLCEVIVTWSGSRHFLLNNMMTHRLPIHDDIGDVLGNFAALYPLEVDWRHNESFANRARRLQSQVLRDMEHVYWPGAKVLQAVNQARHTPGQAVCPFVVGSGLFMGHMDRPLVSHLETPQVLLDCQFWEQTDGSLWVVWDLIEQMFPEGLIDAMYDGYQRLLQTVSTDESAWEATFFDLLPESQRFRRSAGAEVGQTAGDVLHAGLRRLDPERAAAPMVTSGESSLSFGGMRAVADDVARRLWRAGVEPGNLVAVSMPKSIAQVAAVLGVLTAGAGYVPVDPGWPAERQQRVLEDAGVTAVICPAEAPALTAIPRVHVPAGAVAANPEEAAPIGDDATAYVIYTSGSTGRPKGVVLNHRGPLNTVRAVCGSYDITSSDVLFGISSLSFDLSVFDIFGTLEVGAELVLPTESQSHPADWLEILVRRRVTVWNSVPALMQLIVEQAELAGVTLPALRVVMLSGDWIPLGLPDRIKALAPQAQVISLGGATEASIWSIEYPIGELDPSWTSIPYGRAMRGQPWQVLSAEMRDCPEWVPGDLYIGGVGLAQGYLNDPERTAAAFVTDPATGNRLYRTGDRGRYLPSGDIELLGRSDFQVKIQGYRVELGDIEHHLDSHESVSSCVVTARGPREGKQLVAFVVPAQGSAPIQSDALREHLSRLVPRYMVPSAFHVIDQVPLTRNGKVDRAALDGIGTPEQRGLQFCAPNTPTERSVAAIWESVLAVAPIGVDDNFFDLGGQSFAALRVLGQIGARHGLRLPLGELLDNPTISSLARRIDAGSTQRDWTPMVALDSAGDADPWFMVHPAGGQVVGYQQLGRLLGGPLHGFQAPGVSGGEPTPASVSALARMYVRALLAARPSGRILLGGWSSGAVIAFEMASQLHMAGRPVAHLLLIDAPAPYPRPTPTAEELQRWFIEDIARDLPPRSPGDQQRGPVDQLDRELDATWWTFRSVITGCHSYQPAVLRVEATVIRAQESAVGEFATAPHSARPDWGWSALIDGHVTCHQMPGTHHTIVALPHARPVARLMDSISLPTSGRPFTDTQERAW